MMHAVQANVEYWFRLLYECLRGVCYGNPSVSAIAVWLAKLWLWIIGIGYVFAAIGMFFIVYLTIRLFELRKRESEYYSTLIPAPNSEEEENYRWRRIEELANGESVSEWREAIIEADIMLDDALSRHGYVGNGVGEKLKSIDPGNFDALQDAWEVHKVRNQIAHQGSSFDLSETVARRTIVRYETVLRELKEI